MRAPVTVLRVQDAITDLLNDRSLSDLQRLRSFEKLTSDLDAFISDLRSRVPERRSRREESDAGLTRM